MEEYRDVHVAIGCIMFFLSKGDFVNVICTCMYIQYVLYRLCGQKEVWKNGKKLKKLFELQEVALAELITPYPWSRL